MAEAPIGLTSNQQRQAKKNRDPHRVEVKAFFDAPAPYGWQVCQSLGGEPVQRSERGYATETQAWNAGATALHRIQFPARTQTSK